MLLSIIILSFVLTIFGYYGETIQQGEFIQILELEYYISLLRESVFVLSSLTVLGIFIYLSGSTSAANFYRKNIHWAFFSLYFFLITIISLFPNYTNNSSYAPYYFASFLLKVFLL